MSEERQHYAVMTEKRADEILAVGSDAGLKENRGMRVAWRPGDRHVLLDGRFTFEYIEAIAWWVRNKAKSV